MTCIVTVQAGQRKCCPGRDGSEKSTSRESWSKRTALDCRALASSAALSSAAGARSVSTWSSSPGALRGAATSAAVGLVAHTTTTAPVMT